MKPLAPCERCGAQAAGYMDIDFSCTRRRCPIYGLLEAKREMKRVAYREPVDHRAAREALKIMLAVMQFSVEHEDETVGMTKEQLKVYVAKHAPR